MGSSSNHSLQSPPQRFLSRASQVSWLLNVLGAVLALGAIVAAVYRIHKIDNEVSIAENELNSLSSVILKKQNELDTIQSRLNQANAELAFAQATYDRIAKRLPAGTAQQAIQQTLEVEPQAANLPPVIYIHIAREDQRVQAKKIQDRLRAVGCIAPGIEYVGARSPNHSQLRYFVRTEEGPLMDKVLGVLRSEGVDLDAQFIRIASGAPRALRPNQFEVWLGQDYRP